MIWHLNVDHIRTRNAPKAYGDLTFAGQHPRFNRLHSGALQLSELFLRIRRTWLLAGDSPCFLRPVWAPWVQRVPWRWIAVAWDAAHKHSFTTVTGRGGIPLYINMYIYVQIWSNMWLQATSMRFNKDVAKILNATTAFMFNEENLSRLYGSFGFVLSEMYVLKTTKQCNISWEETHVQQ